MKRLRGSRILLLFTTLPRLLAENDAYTGGAAATAGSSLWNGTLENTNNRSSNNNIDDDDDDTVIVYNDFDYGAAQRMQDDKTLTSLPSLQHAAAAGHNSHGSSATANSYYDHSYQVVIPFRPPWETFATTGVAGNAENDSWTGGVPPILSETKATKPQLSSDDSDEQKQDDNNEEQLHEPGTTTNTTVPESETTAKDDASEATNTTTAVEEAGTTAAAEPTVSAEQQPPPQQEQVQQKQQEQQQKQPKVLAVDYASKSAGALILEKSKQFEGTSNLLNGDQDKYAIVPCQEPQKYVVIGLSEDILVKQVILANYERYSSRIKEFALWGSTTATDAAGSSWIQIGTYTALDKGNGKQTFLLERPTWARYLKFQFVSHYGDEHYCTISQITVHGSTVLQGFHEHWEENVQKDAADAADAAASNNNMAQQQQAATEQQQQQTGENNKDDTPDQSGIEQQQQISEQLYNNDGAESIQEAAANDDDEESGAVTAFEKRMIEFHNNLLASDEALESASTKVVSSKKLSFSRNINNNRLISTYNMVGGQCFRLSSPAKLQEGASSSGQQLVIADPLRTKQFMLRVQKLTECLPCKQLWYNSGVIFNKEAFSRSFKLPVSSRVGGGAGSGAITVGLEIKAAAGESNASGAVTGETTTAQASSADVPVVTAESTAASEAITNGAATSTAATTGVSTGDPTNTPSSASTQQGNNNASSDESTTTGAASSLAVAETMATTTGQQSNAAATETGMTTAPTAALTASTITSTAGEGVPLMAHTFASTEKVANQPNRADSSTGAVNVGGIGSVNNKVVETPPTSPQASVTSSGAAEVETDHAVPRPPQQQQQASLDEGISTAAASLDKMTASLANLLNRLPSAKCLEKLDFTSFRNNIFEARGLQGPGGVANNNNPNHPGSPNMIPMEPIFKKLTDEIRALQASVTVHDLFAKESVACYQRVLLELMAETESLRIDQEARLRKLELAAERRSGVMEYVLLAIKHFFITVVPALILPLVPLFVSFAGPAAVVIFWEDFGVFASFLRLTLLSSSLLLLSYTMTNKVVAIISTILWRSHHQQQHLVAKQQQRSLSRHTSSASSSSVSSFVSPSKHKITLEAQMNVLNSSNLDRQLRNNNNCHQQQQTNHNFNKTASSSPCSSRGGDDWQHSSTKSSPLPIAAASTEKRKIRKLFPPLRAAT